MTSPWITSSFTITHAAAAAQERVRLMETVNRTYFTKIIRCMSSFTFTSDFLLNIYICPLTVTAGRGRWWCRGGWAGQCDPLDMCHCEASVLLSAQGNGSIRVQLLSVQHCPGQLLPSQPTTLITRTLSPPHWADLDVQIDT